jgi:hypothetical protein
VQRDAKEVLAELVETLEEETGSEGGSREHRRRRGSAR